MGIMTRIGLAARLLGTLATVAACNDLSGINDARFGIVHKLPAGCGPAGGEYACNPLTNEGCDLARKDACDWGENNPTGFQCYPGPNEAKDGAVCDDENGPYCEGGETCGDDARCHRFCCSNADCADAAQACVPFAASFGTFGACYVK
jgi:hypothetical protein